MSREERETWDERFRAGDHAATEPDPFLAQLEDYAELLPPDRRAGLKGAPKAGPKAAPKALDLACGAGRNAVYLAERGWDVTACDISLEGLRRAQSLARERGVRLQLFCQDLSTVQLPAEHFDLVICFFYLLRELFPQIKATLRPHGLVVFKTYTTDQLRFPGRPRHPLHMLEPQELLDAFRDFRVLTYQEIVKDRGVAQLIAQKPPG
jgi:SAM-dependent methyltransferase